MKILINKITLVLCLLSFSELLFSQGLVEVPLLTNSVLVKKWNELKSKSLLRSVSIADTVVLDPVRGIRDDFSYNSPYPDTALWLDKYAYINRGYPVAPITVGVATLDGLNEQGYPYNFAALTSSSAPADSLTSKAIDLNYPPGDSVYFSFYCQPQGRGNAPQSRDSLLLEFKGTGSWKEIWAKKGSSLPSDSSWTLVKIPITDPAFLVKGFQFRFRNYATLSGNFDQWNIDDIYLNRIRSYTETHFDDIAYVYNGTSVIKNYSQMPWRHYTESYLKDSISNLVRNNFESLQALTSGDIVINDSTSGTIDTYPGGTFNILPFSSTHIYTKCDLDAGCLRKLPINTLSLFPSTLSGPTTLSIKQYVNNGIPDFNTSNDTLVTKQEFFNSYAYDDGTAEGAIALEGYNGAQLAEQYVSVQSDSLQAIDIYFNPYGLNTTLYSFDLKVWNDISGVPGLAVYTSDVTLSPIYNESGYSLFTRYFLKNPLYLNAGTFYVGFLQHTDQSLSVGVDKNNSNQSKTFYNVGGPWFNDFENRTLMMRPVFGRFSDFVGIDEHSTHISKFIVYPNPANDRLYLKSGSSESSKKINYLITDLAGRTITENIYDPSQAIDISSLSEGAYFIRINDGSQITTSKFIKVK